MRIFSCVTLIVDTNPYIMHTDIPFCCPTLYFDGDGSKVCLSLIIPVCNTMGQKKNIAILVLTIVNL